MESAEPLDFERHYNRLTQLYMATLYAIRACEYKEEIDAPEVLRIRREMADQVGSILKERVQAAEIEEVMDILTRHFQVTDVAKPLILSFTLVSYCTEFEVFVSELVRAILCKENRLLKSLASEKNVTGAELADLGSYEAVIGRLHDKITKEILDSGPRKILTHHLGKRLSLFSENEFVYDSRNSAVARVARGKMDEDKLRLRPPHWSVADFERVFSTRHAIVHAGKLPVADVDEIYDIWIGFSWAEAFLALRALNRYSIPMKDEMLLQMAAGFHGIIVPQISA